MKGENAKPFKILSLDGGGIRGAFTAGYLAEIEKRLECRIKDYFDLIAGTSTGGIIAAALALGEPASRIESFYRDRGKTIFGRRKALGLWPWQWPLTSFMNKKLLKPNKLDYDHLMQSKYNGLELKKALEEVFDGRLMESSKTRLLIPSLNVTTGRTKVFKTPHFPELFIDRYLRVSDVLMATTAAPTYFPHAVIKGGSYVDGGVWINNPSMAAIVEALKIRECANREGIDHPIEQESILLLSIGTGSIKVFANPPPDGAGVMWWAPHLLNISGVAQSQGVNFQAQYMLGDRVERIDFEMPDGGWALDDVAQVETLIHSGQDRCGETLSIIREKFFGQKAMHPFKPFPDSNLELAKAGERAAL